MSSCGVPEEQSLSSCPQGHVWEPTGSSSGEVSAVSAHWGLFIQQQEHRTASLLIQPLLCPPECLWAGGLCGRTAVYIAGDTPSLSSFSFSSSCVRELGFGGLPQLRGRWHLPLSLHSSWPASSSSHWPWRPGQMCSLVCLKQLPTLPPPSKHLQEPTAGVLPVLELLALPFVPNPAQGAANDPPRAPGSAGEGGCSSPAHPKTESPFLVLKMRFPS